MAWKLNVVPVRKEQGSLYCVAVKIEPKKENALHERFEKRIEKGLE
jgi:hypothetical protein